MKPDLVWGEPLTSLPLIRKPASGTRACNGGRKISTKTVRKKRLPVVVMGWNLAWWLTTTDYFRKCKNMEYQNSGPSSTLIQTGQTCFSVFAGLQVLYLNLTLASWFFWWVPHLLVPVVVARQRLLSRMYKSSKSWVAITASSFSISVYWLMVVCAPTAINCAVKHSKTLQLEGMCRTIAKIS